MLKVNKFKLISLDDAYLQMLLHLNEDFNDDILLDTMNQLGFGWMIAMLNNIFNPYQNT